MNCKQAKPQLALLIGNDLEPSVAGLVREHLELCADCRQHLQRLSNSLEAIQTAPAGPWDADRDSLWPKLSVRLAAESAGHKPHRMSGWAPTLAVAAACTVMFFIASHQWGGGAVQAPPGGLQIQPVQDPQFNGLPDADRTQPSTLPADDESDILVRGRNRFGVPIIPVGEPESNR